MTTPNEDQEFEIRCWCCGSDVEVTEDSGDKKLKYLKCKTCSDELDRLADIESRFTNLQCHYKLLEARSIMTSEFISKWRNFNNEEYRK